MFHVFTINNILRAVVDKCKTNGGLDVRKSIRDVIVGRHNITVRPSTLIIMRVYFLLMFFFFFLFSHKE